MAVKICLVQVDVDSQPEFTDVYLLRSRAGQQASEENGMIMSAGRTVPKIKSSGIYTESVLAGSVHLARG